MIKIGMLVGDRYEILEKIGTGGMSDVYKAKCHKLNRFVAVKVLKQEFSENANFVSKFRIEAQAAAGLMHSNIVNVYDVGEEDGTYYIVMELVEGITLKNYIEKKARLSVKEAVSIAIQVSMGIEAAHNNHIIHRDIKPQNIIISKEGKVKVTDFGIAKAATSNTITSNVMGSVHYTSPEQARGGFSDEKSDIYSLGCTMFEMLTGRVPFDGETTVAIAIKHIQEEMVSPREYVPEIPVSVEQIIFKATQKSPDRRYQSMGELIEDLKRSLISPDEDFVKIVPVDAKAATKLISEADIAQIKDKTASIHMEQIQEAAASPAEQSVQIPNISKQAQPQKTVKPATKAVTEEDDEEEDDFDPRMEKITAILAIVAAVIVGLLILFLIARGIGLFGTGNTAGNDAENQTQQETQDDTTQPEETNTGEQSTEGQESEDETVEMINVVGMHIDEVQTKLNEMNLGCRIASTEESDTLDKDYVISQSILQGEKVDKYTTIELVVSSGIKGYEVPNVLNLKSEDAVKALENVGFKVEIKNENHDTVEKGNVISQSPSANSKMEKGSTVTITVSDGKAIVEVPVPDLRGMTESAAKAKLEESKLKLGEVKEDYNDETPAGCVITQTQTPGNMVEEGSTVGITLSLGKKISSYKYVATLSAPTGYTSGAVTITITADNGDIRSFTTTSFPCAVNETGFKVGTGTITYTFTAVTNQTEIDPNTGEEVIVPVETTVTTPAQAITFEPAE